MACTNSKLCACLAKFLKEIGFEEIILAEGSTHCSNGNPDSIQAMKNNGFSNYEGLWSQIDCNKDNAGKWFEIFSPGDQDCENKNPFDIELGISEIATRYPIISVAKYKSHDVLGLTLSVKNLMGCLCKARRISTGEIIEEGARVKSYMHGFGPRNPSMLTETENLTISKTALAININRMAKIFLPHFSVLDAAPAMEGNGPLRGNPNNLNLIISSRDSVALDSVGCALINLDLNDVPHIKNLERLGLGVATLSKIKIINKTLFLNIQKVAKFKFHQRFEYARFSVNEISLLEKYT